MLFAYLHHSKKTETFLCVCFCLETGVADVAEDAGSEEAEDSHFWEGVTKPGSSKTAASQQENEVWNMFKGNLILFKYGIHAFY